MLGPLLSHPRQTMARSLWICPRRAGPAAEERQGDDQGRQADRKTDRKGGRWGKGELRGGDVPSRRVSPCTLLSYEGGFHSRWPQRRGEEGEVFFLFGSKRTNYCVSQCSWLREVGVSLKGNELVNCAPDGPKWTAQSITECRGRA